jgi:hypothetical protein
VRGISELVSAALLVIIVVTVGTLVVSRIIESASYGAQVSQMLGLKQVISARQALAVVYAAVNHTSSTLDIIVGTGDFPVNLQAVYANETLLTNCTASWDNSTAKLTGNNTVTLPPYTLARITCTLPKPGVVQVKVYYEGGAATAIAR